MANRNGDVEYVKLATRHKALGLSNLTDILLDELTALIKIACLRIFMRFPEALNRKCYKEPCELCEMLKRFVKGNESFIAVDDVNRFLTMVNLHHRYSLNTDCIYQPDGNPRECVRFKRADSMDVIFVPENHMY